MPSHRRSRSRSTAPLLAMCAALLALGTLAGGAHAAPPPQAPERAITVMTYNIQHGRSSDDRLVNLERQAAVIRESGADIVGLQEVDRHWSARSGFQDEPAVLAELLDMYVVYGANLDLDPLEPGQPRRQYGTAILSRFPIVESHNIPLPKTVATNEQRGLLEAVLDVRGARVRVYNTHLQHNNVNDRIAQVETVLDYIGTPVERVLLMGDFNARPDTAEIAPVYHRFDDAWVEGGDGGDGFTISPHNPYARIDYIFVSRNIKVARAAVPRTLASDHLPLVADVIIPGTTIGVGRQD